MTDVCTLKAKRDSRNFFTEPVRLYQLRTTTDL